MTGLRLVPLRQQLLSHALFGGERINEKFYKMHKTELESLDVSFYCNFHVVDQDVICNDIPSVSYEPLIEKLQSMKVEMFGIENNSGPIDILVGSDVAIRLFTEKKRVLSSILVAMETYLWWILTIKTNLLPEKEGKAMKVISMFVRKTTISDVFSIEV